MAIRKFFHNLSQGPPNPGFMQKKVQKGDFLKKDSRELNYTYFDIQPSRKFWSLCMCVFQTHFRGEARYHDFFLKN